MQEFPTGAAIATTMARALLRAESNIDHVPIAAGGVLPARLAEDPERKNDESATYHFDELACCHRLLPAD
jgi:hypothetical protein